MTKIGKRAFAFLYSSLTLLIFTCSAHATVTANVDRNEVPLDESISLKISVSGDSGGGVSPKFDAPDFEIMNQFQNSQFSSVYINGKFENKSENSITYILRPLKLGALKIRNISNAGEKAADITVQVIQENLYKKTVQSDAPNLTGDAKSFFVKTEINKTKIYKGEQIVVSYYLYRRTRAQIRDVMQYPSFQGFIREDLEMPILSGHPDFEAVNLGGIPFERALIARYAIYPIREGKLSVDGFAVRVDYVPKNTANEDMMEDPFFQFFSQVTPRTGTARSDPLQLNVLPLPEEGRSSLFTGGVGDFEVSATIDSTPIKANSPVTLHVNVRGKGNTSLIEFPTVNWPSDIKFYESQGKTKNVGQGASEKSFDVVLIPKQKGEITIPPIEFEFFSTETRSYIKKKTAAIPIHVAEGDPNSAGQVIEKSNSNDERPANDTNTPKNNDYGSLRPNEKHTDGTSSFLGQPWWRWVAWFGLLVFFSFFGLVLFDQAKKRSAVQLEALKRKQNAENFWKQILREAEGIQSQPTLAVSCLEKTIDELYKTLDLNFGLSSRATPARDLAKILTENHNVTPGQWKETSEIFEFSEMLRFSSHNQRSSQELQDQVIRLIENAKKLCSDFSSKKLEKTS